MRRMLWVFGLLLVLWCGWWFLGRSLILREAEALIAGERAAGAELSYSDFGLRGFPSRFDLTARDLRYIDATGRFGFEGPVVWLYAMSWKPWHIILGLPERQKLTLDGREFTLEGKGLQSSLRAAPEMDLPLAEWRLSGETLQISDAGSRIGIESLSLGLRDAGEAEAVVSVPLYQLGLHARGIAPDPVFARTLAEVAIPDQPLLPLPALIDEIGLDLRLTLSAKLDRHLGNAKPQPLALDLRALSLSWGELQLVAKGALTPDARGYAAGKIELTATHWQYLPVLLVASGAIEARMAPLLQNMLKALAMDAGTPDQIILPLVLKDGWINFGPLPLGEAPKLGPLPAGG